MEKGMLVTRSKYNHDVVFEIVDVIGNTVYLKGKSVRLCADALIDDLVVCKNDEEDQESVQLISDRDKNLVNGCVLHLDGDETYLKKSIEVYRKYGVPVQGYFMKEEKMPENVTNLLVKHKPDILVITGHDNRKIVDNKKEIFENSKHFIKTVKNARVYQADKDALVVFAGACQSYYEALIESGANFASSPSRKNINVLDPVYIAINIAKSHVGGYINVENLLENTVSKNGGIGGVDTRGVARRLY